MDVDELERKSLINQATAAQAHLYDAEATHRAAPTSTTRIRIAVAIDRLQQIRKRLIDLGLRRPPADDGPGGDA